MNSPLRILMLEDSDSDAGLIERAIRKDGIQYESRRVDDRAEFTAALTKFHPDVILSDHSLPQFNSLEALKISSRLSRKVPFILVTGAVSDEFAVNCLKMGADDYVLKSNLTRLPAAIRNALKQHDLDQKRLEAERNLRVQNEELFKTNRELDSFVYNASHNLRAPLMSVLGLVHLAQTEDNKRGGTLTEYFKMIERSVAKLDETLHEILDYSRNARSEIKVDKVSVKALIEDCMERIKYLHAYQMVRMEVHVDERTKLCSDAYRLSVIFTNLLSNAIKYRDKYKEESFCKITVLVTPTEAQFEVTDNGIGIDNSLLTKVFDMFFRGSAQSEGAGLGLFIVKENLDKLAGKIEVSSTYGEGTTIKFQIPNRRIE